VAFRRLHQEWKQRPGPRRRRRAHDHISRWRASHYVGLDYAAALIEVCQTKFPQLDFRAADAVDLSAFQDESFDEVVFSLNGIDMLPSATRRACLQHIYRVLRPVGVLIFSSHYALAAFLRALHSSQLLQRSYGVCFDLGMIFTE
jgi:ubiquinone/menaquinone biosynthesis C-methylase UbiE